MFLILLVGLSPIFASGEGLDELIRLVKEAKAREYQYEPCNLETSEFELSILRKDSNYPVFFKMELPLNYHEVNEFCGRWGKKGDMHALYGWRKDELRISLNPDVSDAGEYLVFTSTGNGVIKSVSFSGSKLEGLFEIRK